MRIAPCVAAFALGRAALFAAEPAPAPAPAAETMPAPPAMPGPPRPIYGEDPWMELRAMQDRVNRIMEESFGRIGPLPSVPWAVPSFDYSPDVDVRETDAVYVVTCDLPGMEKSKIEVSFRDGCLVIRGNREEVREEARPAGLYLRERSMGSFERVVPVGVEVKEDAITAEYKNGVLTVTLPKTEAAAKPGRKIQVL